MPSILTTIVIAVAFAATAALGIVPGPVLDLAATRDRWADLAAECSPHHHGYCLVTWHDEVPAEYVEGYCALQEAFNLEAPAGDLYGDHWSVTGARAPDADSPDQAVYLPGRNLLLLAKTGVFAAAEGCGSIVMGPLSTSPFPDATPAFFEAMGTAIGLGMGRGTALPIETPLAGHTKPEVVRRGAEAGARLDLTFSCLAPTPDLGHCGACNKCGERRRAFAAAGVEDPTEYTRGNAP